MKLAVFSGQYFWFDGKHYTTDEAFVKFVSSFYPYFEKIIFCDAVSTEKKAKPYVLNPSLTEVCPLPYFSVYSFWKNILVIYPKIYRIVTAKIKQWDIVWLPAPHPVSLIFAYVCFRHKRPFFLMVRQNLIEQVKHRNRGIKKYFAMIVVAILDYVYKRIAARNLTFTVGNEMYEHYRKRGGPVHEISVSLVSEKDIKENSSDKGHELRKPLRLLSVCRLDPEKGLHYLIEAVEKLIREKGLEVVLKIAGKGFTDGEDQKLLREVKRRTLSDHVQFLGHIRHGPELFQLYRNADMFVLPSLTGEGIPQTLFEAMACGVPIVATQVAGVPDVIKHERNGILIKPASSTEICHAILRLFTDAQLRKQLIQCGLDTVKSYTLEIEREKMMSYICRIIDEAKSISTQGKVSFSNI